MVVWGHEISGDPGDLLQRRLLAAARGEAPQREGLVTARLRDLLPSPPVPGDFALHPAAVLRQAASAALRQGVRGALQGQLARAIPGLGALTGGRAARATLAREGQLMIAELERIYGVSASDDLAPIEAVELPNEAAEA